MNLKTSLKVLSLPSNENGRDFIIGDLHGCLPLLNERLEEVNFDKTKDRLFCTGDIIDRGNDSRKCLDLLYEPWFFTVQGNHERMFLTFTLNTYSNYHSGDDFIRNGGHWIYDPEITKQEMVYFANKVNELPFIINVGNEDGFMVTHSFLNEETLTFTEDAFVWNRDVFYDIKLKHYKEKMEKIRNLEPLSFVKFTEVTDKLTYVGHNTIKHKFLIDNNLLIDTGAYMKNNSNGLESKFGDLTILEHKSTLQLLKDMPCL